MNRLQNIENALAAINETVFQELCDAFLFLKNDNYKIFSRTGTQTGKQKTTKGPLDSFLLLPNGKYIFVEYSTNVTRKLSKLKEDIKKCIDVKKTNIPIREIAEIIICINFNLNTEEIKELERILSKTNIILTLYTLDALASELHLQYRNLVHDYLGLPLDKGQIVSIDKFIDEYNKASKGIATPLNNTFLHRTSELNDLKSLINQNDLVILYGSPGVGKTKLAIETINYFIKENLTYNAFCISYKNATLIEDLYQNLSLEKNYILFVDDANRIDAFEQIIGFYKTQRTGNLKILTTIRDYALHTVKTLYKEFSFALYTISKLKDEQIIDIIKKEPFGILNSQYHGKIIRIANGNPRLAIMTALLAKKEQSIYALNNVSDLFEKYFSTFIKDGEELLNPNNIKILGIIAFFYTIPYKDRELTIPILENFEINYNTFIDRIEQLDRLELVEIQHEYVKIPEQNLATYFFYKAFIKDNLLSFRILLEKYFDNNANRFTNSIIPATNIFHQNVVGKIQPVLQTHWDSIKHNEERALKLLSVFCFYLQNEALEFVFNIIESLPENNLSLYEVRHETNDFENKKNEIIDLLGSLFLFQNSLKSAIELSFEYVRKLPSNLSELIHKIKKILTFDWEDERYEFTGQSTLFQLLINKLNDKDILYSKAFFELSKTFLSFEYHKIKDRGNAAIIFYNYSLPNHPRIRDFRKNIWEAINNNFSDDAFEILQDYLQKSHTVADAIKEIMEYDIQFLTEIIERHLTPDSFVHCKYVQKQIRWCKKNEVFHPDFDFLCSKFTNPLYELHLKLNWSILDTEEKYDLDNYEKYEKIKESEIRNSFVFNNESDLKGFHQDFVYLNNIEVWENWDYSNVFDIIVDENCSKNFELGCQLLAETIKNDIIGYVPKIVFRNHLITEEKVNYIWNLLQAKNFANKSVWELSFYNNISDSLVTTKYIPAIKSSITNINYSISTYLGGLQRFINIEPRLSVDLLQIIVDRNEKGEKIYIWRDFFNKHFKQFGTNISLIKKAYIQQVAIQNSFDHKKEIFLKILAKEPHFLIKYVEALFLKDSAKYYLAVDHKLGIVWQIDNIEFILNKIFDLSNKKGHYWGISEHFCNSFFWNLPTNTEERAKQFLLNYCKKNYKNYGKINILVDIVRHSMKEFYNDILLQFISLTQDVNLFSKIWWRGGGGVFSGNTIIGNIEASEWRNILSIIEKYDLGIKLIPIKQYINSQVNIALRRADAERKIQFVERGWNN